MLTLHKKHLFLYDLCCPECYHYSKGSYRQTTANIKAAARPWAWATAVVAAFLLSC